MIRHEFMVDNVCLTGRYHCVVCSNTICYFYLGARANSYIND